MVVTAQHMLAEQAGHVGASDDRLLAVDHAFAPILPVGPPECAKLREPHLSVAEDPDLSAIRRIWISRAAITRRQTFAEGFPFHIGGEGVEGNARHLDVDVDPTGERPAQARPVLP